MLLRPHIVAATLGVTLTDSDQALAEGTHGEAGHDAIERAVVMRAVERWPVRTGEPAGPWDDHRAPDAPGPDAAVRHTCAGALVWGLCGAGGFRYGTCAPILRIEDGEPCPIGCPPPERGRYEIAERVMWAWLGAAPLDDPEPPNNDDPRPPRPRPDAERAPDRIHAVAVDLAIDLVCAPRHVIAVAAGGAAWLLAHYPGSWAVARARRMLVAAAGEWEPR